MKFKQYSWLKNYISLITKYTTNSRNIFEKKLYKLLNNSVFGALSQNNRKLRNNATCYK